MAARGGFLKFVLYHLLRCAAASRKLTKLHRSQQKAPQELFYRLAPSPVRIPVFITNKKPLRRVVFFIGSEGRIPQVRFVPFASLRCASRKLTKLHRSQQKAPQELFYRLAPSPVRIPVFITNKKNHSKEWFFFIGSEGRIRTVDTRIMIPLL